MSAQAARPAVYLCPSQHSPALISLASGLLTGMEARYGRVGVFRPIVASSASDTVLDALVDQAQHTTDAVCWGATAQDFLDNPAQAMAQVISRYASVAAGCDAVMVLGSEYDCELAPVEFAWNTKVAANIDVPMSLVVSTLNDVEQISARIRVAINEASRNYAQVSSVILARFPGQQISAQDFDKAPVPVFVLDPVSGAAAGYATGLGSLGEVLSGSDKLGHISADQILVADMTVTNLLKAVNQHSIVMFSGDRSDVGMGLVIGAMAGSFSLPAAAVATGDWPVNPEIVKLWRSAAPNTPLIHARMDTPAAAHRLAWHNQAPTALSSVQIEQAASEFERQVDLAVLCDRAGSLGREDVVTPLMFEHRLLERARQAAQHIVLPEGEEERILRATDRLLRHKICRITLLGDPAVIDQKAKDLGLDIDAAQVINPQTSELREKFAAIYAELRASKGVTLEQARERVADVSYFGTMMVREGMASGMVSGSVNTTAHTIRPSFEVIKTKPGVSVVSSVFLMCLDDKVLVFGDCAVNPNPTPEQVADIAISSADTARQFGVEPRVALLSYSTGSSGTGPDVDATVEATRIVKEKAPDLLVDGPLQYDAAVEPSVARTKMPNSPVAGKATVLIFPDLKTGNNTYKAVQRSAGALAIGPVLQGLNKPVNDLSRGALVSDIVNTVAITAIQAGMS